MASESNDAGAKPAFMDYQRLGGGYALLWQQWLSGRNVHAYLLTGPKGVGKATFARTLAAMRLCTSSQKPCGTCDACDRVFTGNEPDVLEIYPEEGKAIPIDRIRQVLALIAQHTLGGGSRIVIVEPLEKLTPAAQNCLLKSLEEPPADVVFFLLSHEPSAVLGTISSRCSLVKLAPWPDDLLHQTLLARHLSATEIDAALPRASGNIGMALSILKDEAGESRLAQLARDVLSARGDLDIVTLSTQLKDDRNGAEQVLVAIEQALHQALMLQTGLLPPSAIADPVIGQWGRKADAETLSALLSAVFDTRRYRQNQVNWQAGIDRLLMKILEAKTKWQLL